MSLEDIKLKIDELIKSRSGIYKDTSENRKLGRVGQKYGSKKDSVKTDKSGNIIGSGDFHSKYDVEKFDKYPSVSHKVNKSNTTESVYVTYYNKDNNKSITVRFSEHESNAVKFGDQLNGFNTSRDEILYHLGLKERVFIPNKKLSIFTQSVSKKSVKDYEMADKTIKELYELGAGADISKYKGKLAKDSNMLILSDKVTEDEEFKINPFGQKVLIGNYIYKDIKKAMENDINKGLEPDIIKALGFEDEVETYNKHQEAIIKGFELGIYNENDLEKAIGHKYFKREPKAGGGYKYYYTEAQYKKEKQGEGDKKDNSEQGFSPALGDKFYSTLSYTQSAAERLEKPENYSVLSTKGGFILTTNKRASKFVKEGKGEMYGRVIANGGIIKDTSKEKKEEGENGKLDIKNMKKVKVNGLNGYMPGHNFIYQDNDSKKWFFKDNDGELMELKNEGTLKELQKFLSKK